MEWRRGLGISDDIPVIGFLGRLVMEKGLDVFSDTIDQLKRRNVPHQVLVIGEGPARAWFESRIPEAKFAGFQVLFLCTLSQFLLLPVLWSFWVTPLGIHHPIASALPFWAAVGLFALFILTEGVNIALGLFAQRLTRHRMSWLWVPLMHFYFPLGALASYKAAWEVVQNPFYWDKTTHGHFDPL
jgi:hypothetical protein